MLHESITRIVLVDLGLFYLQARANAVLMKTIEAAVIQMMKTGCSPNLIVRRGKFRSVYFDQVRKNKWSASGPFDEGSVHHDLMRVIVINSDV